LLPRGIPHAFSVIGGVGAKLLQISSPADFEQFAAEAGEPAPSLTLPPPAEPNIPKLLAAMAKYGKRMAGRHPPGKDARAPTAAAFGRAAPRLESTRM
jgi:hypothetical protein